MARQSPAQRFFARRMAAEAAAMTAATAVRLGEALDGLRGAPATAYELQRAELDTDLQALRQVQSIEHKAARKREIIGKYDPWVAGVLDAHKAGARAVQDEVLLQVMIWSLDIEDYDRALPLVDYVLSNELALPERFRRTAATLIAEESADCALKHLAQGGDANLTWLQIVEEATRAGDMIDQVRAKLHKAIGLAFVRIAEAEPGESGPAGAQAAARTAAIENLKRALDLHEKCGVKKEIERLERAAAKATPPANP